MREIRGAGEQHVEEGGEEEKDFEEDEVIESEAEAVAETKADEGSNEVKTEAAGGDDEKNQNKAKQEEKEDKKNESSSLNKANSTDSFDAQMVLRRIRGKRTVHETPRSQSVRRKLEFSPTSAESAPAMKASPTSATSASGGSKQKQSTLKRFFSSESVGTEELELEEEPQLPPKKREKIEDVIRSLLHQGIVNKDGQVVQWTETDMAAIKEATEKKLTDQMVPSMRNRGGRPEVMQELKRGLGGGLKSNRRLKHQKKKRHDLPVSHKHALCQQIFGMRQEHKNEEELLMHAAKKFKMKRGKLRYIWNRRSEWKMQMEQHGLSTSEQHVEGRSARRGSHGPGATKVVRMRAKGGGRKLQFPSIYEQIRTWVELERSHCHTVLPRHVGWKFHELLLQYHQELQAKNEQGSISNEEKKDLGNSTKMLKGLEEPKNLDRRARHVIESIGAKVRSPNLTTQLSDVEQQIRAELSWNQHDYQIWRIAQTKDEDYKELFSRPDQAKQQMRKCVLHFSDQIPLWVKKPSNREVFAAHEAKKSAKHVTSHREKIREELDKKAHEKGIVETENQQKGDEEKDQQIVPRDEGEEWHIPEAADRKSSGKKHLTTMREQNVDKYRITFEAHQSVLNFFDPDENPLGVVSPGILIVPGPHASLANISETGEWLQDETYTYMGQKRTHKKGNNVGRTLEPWRKLRKDEPQLLRHFHVYSQPSSNTDGIIMSWVIRDMSHKAGMRLHQRDCFGAAFVDQVRQMQFLAHEVPSSIVAKMTSALQLTDTDFSHQFKACVRQSVDETMRTGMQKQRRDEATPSEQYKMSLRDVAVALDSSMQRMIDRNDEDQWVLAGLRRNGFLAFRPDRSGHMVYQQDQSWCKDKPIGSTRISSHWLKNRMSWIKEAGRSVDPPIWERIEGAKELADLLEWSYQQQGLEKNEAVLDLEGADEPDWVTCGQFQLPLDLRRDLSIREKTLPEEARKKREKIRSKRNEKKMRAEAKKALSEQQREEILNNLQSKSRLEAMMDIKPSAKKPTAKLLVRKKRKIRRSRRA